MMARRKKEKSFSYTGGSASRPPGFNAIMPAQAGGGDRKGGTSPPLAWSGPGVSTQVASLQSLILRFGQPQFSPL